MDKTKWGRMCKRLRRADRLLLPKPDGAEAHVDFTDYSQSTADSETASLKAGHFFLSLKSLIPFGSVPGRLTH